jgi:hypothetical protein
VCVCVLNPPGSACIHVRCVYSESARICGTIRRHTSDWSRKCVLTADGRRHEECDPPPDIKKASEQDFKEAARTESRIK